MVGNKYLYNIELDITSFVRCQDKKKSLNVVSE